MEVDESENGSPSTFREADICTLLNYFAHNTYSASPNGAEPRPYIKDSIKLMERDYFISRVDNEGGKLCPQYPAIIPIMEFDRSVSTIYENEDDAAIKKLSVPEIAHLFERAKLARCRQRFPVPVILLNGKHICRSSTLASEPEMCYRTGLINVPGYELLRSVKELWWPTEGLGPTIEVYEDDPKGPGPYDNDIKAQTICTKVRNSDIKLLKSLDVKVIVDIMVEKRKVKHSLYVSASEKVDIRRYSNFKLISLPYPGCEFFKKFHDSMFNAEGLNYDWMQAGNDADLSVPNDYIKRNLLISWRQYKEWDLVLITQNYMKYILKRLQEDNSGLLIHCISGWDRTPLFISLIRLSLWADYLIHPSLNEYEILYLTLAYDWYLFGHHLSNRLYKNEEIMAFCFDFLRYIVGDDFSSKGTKKKHTEDTRTDEGSGSTRSHAHTEEVTGQKRKRARSSEYQTEEVVEESDGISVESVFDGANNSFTEGEPMDTKSISSSGSKAVLLAEDEPMELNGEHFGRNKILSPTNLTNRKTSPIPIAGPGGTRRQRSESTGSTTSNISSNWQIISDCGSVERDCYFKPQRQQRLEKVRTIFSSCYQKTVKNESFGPPKKWMVEEIVGSFSQWSQKFDILPESSSSTDNLETENLESDFSAESTINLTEVNGNNSSSDVSDTNNTHNGNGDGTDDTDFCGEWC